MEIKYTNQLERQLDDECGQVEIERNDNRKEVVKWLASQNTRYHLTITFIEETSEEWNRKLLNKLLKQMNRNIYKSRYIKGQNYIKGLAIREATRGFNTDHYHLMLMDHEWMPEFHRMNELIGKHINYFGYNEQNKHCKRNFISTYKLQDYYNLGNDGLENYLTKNFEFLCKPVQECIDSIGTLTGGDVIFGRDRFKH